MREKLKLLFVPFLMAALILFGSIALTKLYSMIKQVGADINTDIEDSKNEFRIAGSLPIGAYNIIYCGNQWVEFSLNGIRFLCRLKNGGKFEYECITIIGGARSEKSEGERVRPSGKSNPVLLHG